MKSARAARFPDDKLRSRCLGVITGRQIAIWPRDVPKARPSPCTLIARRPIHRAGRRAAGFPKAALIGRTFLRAPAGGTGGRVLLHNRRAYFPPFIGAIHYFPSLSRVSRIDSENCQYLSLLLALKHSCAALYCTLRGLAFSQAPVLYYRDSAVYFKLEKG